MTVQEALFQQIDDALDNLGPDAALTGFELFDDVALVLGNSIPTALTIAKLLIAQARWHRARNRADP
jgi:hypothetical protein